jgi:hypothetical protein
MDTKKKSESATTNREVMKIRSLAIYLNCVIGIGAFTLPTVSAQVDWTPATKHGIISITGTPQGAFDIDITRSHTDAGLRVFNTNVSGRSLLLFGQSYGGKYGYLAHHGESHNAGTNYTESFKASSTVLVGSDINGLGIASAQNIRFYSGGLEDSKLRMTVNGAGEVRILNNLWVEKGAYISSDFPDSDPGGTWSTNLSVRNNNGADNTFSRLAFVSASGGYGAISVKKTGEFSGDMYLQVRSHPGYYITPMLIRSNGNVGIGSQIPSEKLEVRGNMRVVGPTDGNTHSELQFYRGNGHKFATIGQADLNAANSPFDIHEFNGNDIRILGVASEFIRIKASSGNVGIGSTNPNEKLTVNGTIYGKEVKVDLNVPGPDYVFEKDYDLQPLSEVESFINQHKHLPEIPSADEMKANGIYLQEMNMLLLKKVEELTLHLIRQEKEIENLKQKVYEKN